MATEKSRLDRDAFQCPEAPCDPQHLELTLEVETVSRFDLDRPGTHRHHPLETFE